MPAAPVATPRRNAAAFLSECLIPAPDPPLPRRLRRDARGRHLDLTHEVQPRIDRDDFKIFETMTEKVKRILAWRLARPATNSSSTSKNSNAASPSSKTACSRNTASSATARPQHRRQHLQGPREEHRARPQGHVRRHRLREKRLPPFLGRPARRARQRRRGNRADGKRKTAKKRITAKDIPEHLSGRLRSHRAGDQRPDRHQGPAHHHQPQPRRTLPRAHAVFATSAASRARSRSRRNASACARSCASSIFPKAWASSCAPSAKASARAISSATSPARRAMAQHRGADEERSPRRPASSRSPT